MTAQRGDFDGRAPVSATRDKLAEALRHLLASDDATMYYDAPHAVWGAGDRYADALLPVVESLADERAAEALEEFAAKWWVWVMEDAPQIRGGAAYRARAEAASLRAASRGDQT